MDSTYKIVSPKNANITMQVTPGHFTTSSSHISHYLDMSDLMFSATAARAVARELAVPYTASTLIDAIVCMEETAVVGAYLARELLQEGTWVINSGGTIHVISPTGNHNGQLIFQKSAHKLIANRNILLLVSSVSSGKTVYRAMDCLTYYGGRLAGICALFAAVPEVYGQTVHSVFDGSDIPEYHFYRAADCKMCQDGIDLDGIVRPGGFSAMPR